MEFHNLPTALKYLHTKLEVEMDLRNVFFQGFPLTLPLQFFMIKTKEAAEIHLNSKTMDGSIKF